MVNILAGNTNSSFLGKKSKLDKNILKYDIGLFFDTRINIERLKLLKNKFNQINKVIFIELLSQDTVKILIEFQ